MIYNEEVASKVAEFLLQIKAIKLEPENPFKWSGGWNSPIYCDNRVTLSHPTIRNYIRQSLVDISKNHFEDPGCIAGVATGGIAHGVLVAQDLGLPFIYVRPENKQHGLQNRIEGQLTNTKNIVVIEDLVSTGKSSMKVVDALRENDGEVKHMAAIFDYGFNDTKVLFEDKKVELITLCNYDTLVKKAIELNYINETYMDTLVEWRNNPAKWGK